MNTSTITKPWIILAYDGYYPAEHLNNIVDAYATEDEATNNMKTYFGYDFVYVLNIVDYMNNTFG